MMKNYYSKFQQSVGLKPYYFLFFCQSWYDHCILTWSTGVLSLEPARYCWTALTIMKWSLLSFYVKPHPSFSFCSLRLKKKWTKPLWSELSCTLATLQFCAKKNKPGPWYSRGSVLIHKTTTKPSCQQHPKDPHFSVMSSASKCTLLEDCFQGCVCVRCSVWLSPSHTRHHRGLLQEYLTAFRPWALFISVSVNWTLWFIGRNQSCYPAECVWEEKTRQEELPSEMAESRKKNYSLL